MAEETVTIPPEEVSKETVENRIKFHTANIATHEECIELEKIELEKWTKLKTW